ncbi:hypothetical protein BMS3Bbin04_01158 [bacterium BMS3Bbin04]|nr:hypothetical protein BMS3Bbin04_01158 [bacterium BMS3Bbin04]
MRLSQPQSLLAILIALTIITLSAQAVDVRISNPVYSFLERADILGYLDKPLPGTKPYTRIDVAKQLMAAAEHHDEMTRVDRDQLEYFFFKYQDELRYLGSDVTSGYRSFWKYIDYRPDWLYPNELDMFYFEGEDSDWQIAMNATGKAEYYDRLGENVGDPSFGSTVVGNGGVLRFRSGRWSAFGAVADNHITMHTDQDLPIADSVRYPYDVSGPTGSSPDLLDFYDSEAELTYQNDHVVVHFGKGRQRWGDGNTGALMINDHALPYTHFRFVGSWGPITYTNVQAHLQTEPRVIQYKYQLPFGPYREIFANKWYSAQRLEFNVHRTFRFGVFERVIYGERGLDWEYVHPLIFLQGQEHFTGDPDNMMVGGDIRWLAFNRAMVHFQFMFDEFVFADLGSDDYSNKWAFLTGVKIVDVFDIPNSQLFVEYARIRPYVYSHKYVINRATHLSANLGYAMQPNSDNLVVGWTQQIARGAAVTLTGRVSRHGHDPAGVVLGGDIKYSDHEDNAIRADIPFLAGDLETQREVGLAVKLELLQQFQTDFNVRYIERELEPLVGEVITSDDVLLQAVFRWYPVF